MHRCTQATTRTQMHTHYTCAPPCPPSCRHVHTQAPPPELCPCPAQPHTENRGSGSSPSAGGRVNTGSSGIRADPATLQSRKAGSGAAGERAGSREDEDRRDTDAAVRGSLHWGGEGSECHSHATPHTWTCAQGSPTFPAETHTQQTEGTAPDSWESWTLSPHGSQAYMHGPLTQPPHLGAAWGLVSFQGLASEVAGLEGPRPHFPWGKHIYPGNRKNNQCSL